MALLTPVSSSKLITLTTPKTAKKTPASSDERAKNTYIFMLEETQHLQLPENSLWRHKGLENIWEFLKCHPTSISRISYSPAKKTQERKLLKKFNSINVFKISHTHLCENFGEIAFRKKKYFQINLKLNVIQRIHRLCWYLKKIKKNSIRFLKQLSDTQNAHIIYMI